MVLFHSYVSLPEGKLANITGFIELDDGFFLQESPIFDGKNHGFL